MKRTILLLMAVSLGVLFTTPVLVAQYDFAAEQEDLDVNGETVEEAAAEAEQALQNSHMQTTISTIGFDIPPGSEAETYLQETAQIGNGAYFTASDSGELTAAMAAAASGQTSMAGGDRVIITTPQEGDTVGPSTTVVGKTKPKELVVIVTHSFDADTGQLLQRVPGIRHRATETGDFSFRIAMPRVSFGDRETRVRYEIHVYIVRQGGYQGPETIINVFSPKP